MVTQPRWMRAIALATTTAVTLSLLAILPTATASADTAPVSSSTPTTVSSDSLPTVQVDGVVWAQVVIGNTVYVGGDFTQAQPAGAAAGVNETPRADMLAYNLTTGALITTFAPTFNAQVRGLAASPDGSTVYAVGNFTQVNGVNAYRVVALNAATGAVNTTFAAKAQTNSAAYTVVATASTVYIGGAFTIANKVAQTRAAAFSATTGALLPWAPVIPDYQVHTMVLSPDGSKMVLGGSFTSVNGNTSPGAGLAEVDTNTGASVPFAAATAVSDSGNSASIMSLTSDGTNIYGSGYVWVSTSGNLEGSFSAKWSDGSLNWVEDCHGDTYGVATLGDAVYTVSHAHDCGRVTGGFAQSSPDLNSSIHQHALAFTKAVTGTLAPWTGGGDYHSWGGTPSPTLLTWYPDLGVGTYTGLNQAAWTVTTAAVGANSGYVLLGGEFPTVNGVRQTGLARFATKDIAPNLDGPRVSGTAWPAAAVSLSSGTARVSWISNYDRDNANLTYTVYRNGGTTPIYTTTGASLDWWSRPQLGFTDTGLTPGATYTYTVKAADPFGNTATSATASVTVSASSSTSSPYSNAVASDGATDFWRLSEGTAGTGYDSVGYSDLVEGAGVTVGASGSIVGDTSTASTFSGDSTGVAGSTNSIPAPNTFTEEAWFNTTSTSGGKIIGFGNTQTGTSSNYDRQVYMSANGSLTFGVYPGSVATLQSQAGLNDGQWHSVVATMGSAGMSLYVDGALVATRTDVTAGQAYNGYWRVGGDNLNGWPNVTNADFAGSIDDVAVYPTVLTAATVKNHWKLSGHALAAPTDAYGKTVFNDSPTLFWRLGDAAGSTTVADSSGNGATGVVEGGVTLGTASSAITAAGKTAATFDGNSGTTIASSTAFASPTAYSEEVWFKTTTTSGGKLIGQGASQSGNSCCQDRSLYMTNSGQLVVGTWSGVKNLSVSPKSYNDGKWHAAVATQGSDGTSLYVDGALVATNSQTSAQNFTAYWRVGGDSIWDGASSAYFNGTMDDVAIYYSELSATQVATHYSVGVGNNQPPVAAFTATPTNLGVAFDGSGSSDPDGTVASYAWNFGDGSTSAASSTATATHTYAAAGTYAVSLTVTDNQGASSTVQKSVTVSVNVPPTSSFVATPTNLSVALDGSASADSDGTIASYAWNFGDSTTGTGVTTNHTYATAGTYTVTLTVTDNSGASTTSTKQVTTTAPNQPPVASFVATSTNLTASLDASASSDPDGTVSNYSWVFGDGSANGTGKTTTHAYAAAGTYTVQLTVTDNQGAMTTISKQVTIASANVAPTASFTTSVSGLQVSADGTGSSDSDGTVASYAWNFGDGSSGTGSTATHTYATAGTFTVTLVVTDNQGATGTTTKQVTVTAPNLPPVSSFTQSVSGLVVSANGTGSSDPDGTIAGYAWNFGDGSTSIGSTVQHTYTAGGTYTVTLTVTDNSGATTSSSQSVTVTAPAATTVLGQDAFGRTVTSGLGSADIGGGWTTSTGGTASVGSGVASFSTKAGGTLSSYLSAISSSASDVSATVSIPALPVGGTAFAGVVGRRVGTDDYNARVSVSTTGAVTVAVLHGGTALKTATVTGLTYTPGMQLRIRLQVTGTSPTTLQARTWQVGSTEPSTWQVSSTDSTAALQAAGSVGLRTYLGSAATNGPLVVSVDDFLASSLAPAAANVPPTASFTSTSSGLTASVDASASTDSDGSIASYAWNFGDGSTATGVTASHTFAAAGTYAVTVTVTDNQGASTATTNQVTVIAPATTHLAQDAFGRTVASGLGTADTGGAWTTAGGAASFGVGSGIATLTDAKGSTLSGYVGGVSSTSTDVSATVAVPVLPVGGSAYSGVVGRRVGSDDYNARISVSSAGVVTIAVLHGGAALKTATVAGLTYTPGMQLRIRLQVTGTSPTTLQARVWQLGSAEPTSWQVSATDTTAALQAAGSVGIRTYLGSGVTNGPNALTIDDFLADQLN